MSTPQDWPADFPMLPGGTEIKAPPAGSVKVAVLAYPETTPVAIDTQFRAALVKAGWTIEGAKANPEAIRYRTRHRDRSVSISIRSDGSRAILQVMQI